MEQLIERACGLDVHKATIAACVRVPGPGRRRLQDVRTFGTATPDLLALRDWLQAHGVTHVAMESTGVYWKPVFYVLEEAVTCVLVNAAHVTQVPGRKTDVQDCAWLAQLLEHGLLRGSFVPPVAIRELRDLTRYRKALIGKRQREANRLHKVLEDAGLKLASVASDILGHSGRAMLAALVEGTTDPEVLADLAKGRLRAKLPALRQALAGRFRTHHAFLVTQILAHLDYLDEAIGTVSVEVEAHLAPFAETARRLDAIPGINQRGAEVVIAELGVDMSVFPTTRHWRVGLGCVPATTKARANTSPARRARGTAGSERSWWNAPWLRSGPRTRTSAHAIGASCATGATRRPWSPSRTRCCGRSTMCSPDRTTPTLAPTTTTAAIQTASDATPSRRSSAWVSRSPSRPLRSGIF